MVESLAALEAGSVSALLGPLELGQCRERLTRWKVERRVHQAVDDARLEAGVCVAKSNCGVHNTAEIASKIVSATKCHQELSCASA
jgi:hypothetical protein